MYFLNILEQVPTAPDKLFCCREGRQNSTKSKDTAALTTTAKPRAKRDNFSHKAFLVKILLRVLTTL